MYKIKTLLSNMNTSQTPLYMRCFFIFFIYLFLSSNAYSSVIDTVKTEFNEILNVLSDSKTGINLAKDTALPIERIIQAVSPSLSKKQLKEATKAIGKSLQRNFDSLPKNSVGAVKGLAIDLVLDAVIDGVSVELGKLANGSKSSIALEGLSWLAMHQAKVALACKGNAVSCAVGQSLLLVKVGGRVKEEGGNAVKAYNQLARSKQIGKIIDNHVLAGYILNKANGNGNEASRFKSLYENNLKIDGYSTEEIAVIMARIFSEIDNNIVPNLDEESYKLYSAYYNNGDFNQTTIEDNIDNYDEYIPPPSNNDNNDPKRETPVTTIIDDNKRDGDVSDAEEQQNQDTNIQTLSGYASSITNNKKYIYTSATTTNEAEITANSNLANTIGTSATVEIRTDDGSSVVNTVTTNSLSTSDGSYTYQYLGWGTHSGGTINIDGSDDIIDHGSFIVGIPTRYYPDPVYPTGTATYQGTLQGDYTSSGNANEHLAISGDITLTADFANNNLSTVIDAKKDGSAWATARGSGITMNNGVFQGNLTVDGGGSGSIGGQCYGSSCSEMGGATQFSKTSGADQGNASAIWRANCTNNCQ